MFKWSSWSQQLLIHFNMFLFVTLRFQYKCWYNMSFKWCLVNSKALDNDLKSQISWHQSTVVQIKPPVCNIRFSKSKPNVPHFTRKSLRATDMLAQCLQAVQTAGVMWYKKTQMWKYTLTDCYNKWTHLQLLCNFFLFPFFCTWIT